MNARLRSVWDELRPSPVPRRVGRDWVLVVVVPTVAQVVQGYQVRRDSAQPFRDRFGDKDLEESCGERLWHGSTLGRPVLRICRRGAAWALLGGEFIQTAGSNPPAYSSACYNPGVGERGDLLGEVMSMTGFTQSALSRVSGVRQPSISQFISGRVELSDDQLDRLLSCMGYRLEVVRRSVEPTLTRSERRSWLLHRQLSSHLDRDSLPSWRPVIERNLQRLRERVTGQPHLRHLERWEILIDGGDELGLHRVLTGLDRESIEMREVSPMGGLLPQEERSRVLALAG